MQIPNSFEWSSSKMRFHLEQENSQFGVDDGQNFFMLKECVCVGSSDLGLLLGLRLEYDGDLLDDI